MAGKELSWKFPQKDFLLLKIEAVTVLILAVIIFLISFQQLKGSWGFSGLFTLFFFGLYFVVSYIIQRIRLAEEHYQLKPPHLQVTRKTRFKTKSEKIDLRKIRKHKLDHFFLGGYLLTDKAKHQLFFNSKAEMKKFEEYLKKHMKKR